MHLFSGDSLFPGGPGKTRSPADFASLMGDLESKVFARFDDRTVVHPGHGDGTTGKRSALSSPSGVLAVGDQPRRDGGYSGRRSRRSVGSGRTGH